MLLKVNQLECRNNPAPTFNWAYNSSVTDRNLTAYSAQVGGGPRVQVQYQDHVVFDDFVFESSQRGGADVSLWDMDGDTDYDMYIGAGAGGGPRVKIYENDGTNHFNLIKDYFIGDPSHRNGVLITHGVAIEGYGPKAEYSSVTRPEILKARAMNPGISTDAFNKEISLLPPKLSQALVNLGYDPAVYHGKSVTVLPEFSYLSGQLTVIDGDGNRTYDEVEGFALENGFVLNESGFNVSIHEIGHYVYSKILTEKQRAEFGSIWSNTSWSNQYESLNMTEAFAESFSRWRHNKVNPPNIDTFFNIALKDYLN